MAVSYVNAHLGDSGAPDVWGYPAVEGRARLVQKAGEVCMSAWRDFESEEVDRGAVRIPLTEETVARVQGRLTHALAEAGVDLAVLVEIEPRGRTLQFYLG